MLVWLQFTGLSTYSGIFARHELDSLLLIRTLSPDNLDQLAREHAAAFAKDDRALWLGSRATLG